MADTEVVGSASSNGTPICQEEWNEEPVTSNYKVV